MRKRILIQLIAVLAIAMFFSGYYDTEVTAFLTLNVKYGLALFFLTILYAYSAFMYYELETNTRIRRDQYEIDEAHDTEVARLHETIIELSKQNQKDHAKTNETSGS